MTSGIVTLLTDFGTEDPFVGVMKGVVLSRNPRAVVVDLTHAIAPQRVGDAAFWLAQAFSWFPPGTVHVAVVDPGVGTERAAVVARAAEHWFVAPDNGLLEVVARRAASFEARAIDASGLGLKVASRTFHGRDVFAPVGALLASGALEFSQIGPLCTLTPTALVPEPVIGAAAAQGTVIVIDHFGNLVTNVLAVDLPVAAERRVAIAGREFPLVNTYADVEVGDVAAVVGSFGQLEVIARNASAAEVLGVERGARVLVSW
jgi:S-adenosylmethionine hydrolase